MPLPEREKVGPERRSSLPATQPFWKAVVFSGTNQVVSSLTNFGLLLYLIRVLEKTSFGHYSIGFACAMLGAGLFASSISVQLVVNLPDRHQRDRSLYAANHLAALTATGVAAIIFAFILSILLVSTHLIPAELGKLASPISFAAVTHGVRDLLIRFAYSERRELLVLSSSAAVTFGMAMALALSAISGSALDASQALFIYGLGQLLGALLVFSAMPLPLKSVRLFGVRQALRDSWTGGRWSMLTTVAYTLRTQAHSFVAGPLLGAAALAELHASRILVTPAVIAIPALQQVLMPRLAEAREEGPAAIQKGTIQATTLLVGAAVAYSIALVLFLPIVIPTALGGTYEHVGPLVTAWAGVAVLLALRNSLTLALEAIRAFRELLLLNIGVAVFAVVLTVILSSELESIGAVFAIAASELLLSVLLFLRHNSHLKSNSSIVPATVRAASIKHDV